jgi:hypothetical protein
LNFEIKVGGYKEDNLRRMCCIAIDKDNKIVPYPSAIEYPPVMLPICELFDSGGSDFYSDYHASTVKSSVQKYAVDFLSEREYKNVAN